MAPRFASICMESGPGLTPSRRAARGRAVSPAHYGFVSANYGFRRIRYPHVAGNNPRMIPCEECNTLLRVASVEVLAAHLMLHHGMSRESAEMDAFRLSASVAK
jgi:hypothetical protein